MACNDKGVYNIVRDGVTGVPFCSCWRRHVLMLETKLVSEWVNEWVSEWGRGGRDGVFSFLISRVLIYRIISYYHFKLLLLLSSAHSIDFQTQTFKLDTLVLVSRGLRRAWLLLYLHLDTCYLFYHTHTTLTAVQSPCSPCRLLKRISQGSAGVSLEWRLTR